MTQKHGIARHKRVEPTWKREVLENRGKRDQTPSAIRGMLVNTPRAPSVLRQSQATVFNGASLKPRILR